MKSVAVANRSTARAGAGLPGGWRNVVSQPQRTAFDGPRGRAEVAYLWPRDGITVVADGEETVGPEAVGPGAAGVTVTARPGVVGAAPDHAVLEVSGVRYRFDVARAGDVIWVDSAFGHIALTPVPRLPAPAPVTESGSLVAPMPGNVVRVEAGRGDRVRSGQPIVVLEAMKMEHQVAAPADGLVAEVRVAAGDQVQAGDVLAIVDEERTGER